MNLNETVYNLSTGHTHRKIDGEWIETSLKALERVFGRMRACDITLDRLNHYFSDRMAIGIAPATAELELTHLHRAFRLAERAGKAACPPFPQITVGNARTGFFERADFGRCGGTCPKPFRDRLPSRV